MVEVLQIFWLAISRNDSQFMNPETLIPTLKFLTNGLLSEGFQEIQIL